MNFWDTTDPDDAMPGALEALIGQLVQRIWVQPERKLFTVLFTNNQVLVVELVESMGPVAALAIQVGEARESAVATFDKLLPIRSDMLDLLIGLPFTGMVPGGCGVLRFGEAMGVQLTEYAIRLVDVTEREIEPS